MQEQSTRGLKGRSEYQAEYYKNVTKKRRKTGYVPQTQYIRLTEVRKILTSTRKRIGLDSYSLISGEIEKLEVKKM